MATSTGTSNDAARARAICTFWLGERLLGLDVSLVGEIVTIEAVAPVALSPPAVHGLFNLRGTPVALLELGTVLGLDDAARRDTEIHTALVVRHQDLVVGFLIDAMESVVAAENSTFTEPGTRDYPAVQGFLEIQGANQRIVTVLEPAVLLERLEGVRFAGVAD